jgi:Flp pilus assembly protein TadD
MRPLALRIGNALVSYVGYLWQTIWPMNLAVFYPFPEFLPAWQVAGAALLLALISAGALCFASRHPYFLVGWLWYLVTLFPVSGLVQWGVWPAMADRFTYVPLIGLFIMVAWGTGEITGRWKHREVVLAASGGAAVLYFSAFTWFQLTHWQNSISLFTRALEVTDNNYIAHNNLGAALKEKAKTDSSIYHYREAIRIAPDYWLAQRNLGNELRIKGEPREAIVHYKEALRYVPEDALTHHNLAMALTMVGSLDEAVKHFRESIRLRPEFEEAYCNLGIVNARMGKAKEAAANFSEALRINPGFVEARKMLETLQEKTQ